VSRSVQCDYCGNQRSVKAAGAGMVEDDVKDLLNFEKSTRYSDRQKAALAYAEAITWHLETDDAFWARLHHHFGEPELVELGCFIALTMGQQSWLRLLNIDHHQVLAGTAASMAPGYQSAEDLRRSKADPSTGRNRGAHEALSFSTRRAARWKRGCAVLSRQVDQDHRAVHARQRDRRDGAHRRRAAQRRLGPAGDRR